MDILNLDTRKKADEGADMRLLDIEGNVAKGADGKPIVFTIYGADGAVAKEALRQFRGKEITDEELAAKLLKGWSDNFTIGKKKAEFTPENVNMVVQVPEIQTQIVRFIGDRGNFTSTK